MRGELRPYDVGKTKGWRASTIPFPRHIIGIHLLLLFFFGFALFLLYWTKFVCPELPMVFGGAAAVNEIVEQVSSSYVAAYIFFIIMTLTTLLFSRKFYRQIVARDIYNLNLCYLMIYVRIREVANVDESVNFERFMLPENVPLHAAAFTKNLLQLDRQDADKLIEGFTSLSQTAEKVIGRIMPYAEKLDWRSRHLITEISTHAKFSHIAEQARARRAAGDVNEGIRPVKWCN